MTVIRRICTEYPNLSTCSLSTCSLANTNVGLLRRTPMKPTIATVLILFAPVLIVAEHRSAPASRMAVQDKKNSIPAVPLLSPAICGKSNLLFKLGDQSIGNETFEIKCQPDGGYSATGHTALKVPGASTDLTTTVDLDKAGSPTSST